MSILQGWLVVVIPSLIAAFALLYGRSRIRTLLGYLVLLAGFGVMLFIDRPSAVIVGGIAALLYAGGRGGQAESEQVDTSQIGVPDTVRRPARHRTG